jgi:TolB-like protein/class 3 adenylate cyclase/Flp pilus assembly protein TadD
MAVDDALDQHRASNVNLGARLTYDGLIFSALAISLIVVMRREDVARLRPSDGQPPGGFVARVSWLYQPWAVGYSSAEATRRGCGQMPERKLAAILCADVAGYSRLMEADEDGTLAALSALRQSVVDLHIRDNGGRIFKTTGDGVLAEFPSAISAVRCAVEIQKDMARTCGPIRFRIGVNLGDVIYERGDVFGDGVNVAARLEALAEPGATYVAKAVFDQVQDRIALDHKSLGEYQVKNISRPVAVYQVTAADAYSPSLPAKGLFRRRRIVWIGAGAVAAMIAVLALVPALQHWATGTIVPPRPAAQLSVAVLPFVNASGGEQQAAFVDGITDDLITDLSRIADAFVISRNTSFSLQGKDIDARSVARDLGVRYVLEGNVRKSGDRVRVNAQLIDGSSGIQVWADRFEVAFEDTYALQDRVTGRIARALNIQLKEAVSRRAARGRPEDLAASDLATRGWAILFNRPQTKETNEQARPLLEDAISRDPHNAEAWTALAYMHARAALYRWSSSRQESLQHAIGAGERAIALDPRNADAYYALGFAVRVAGDEHRARQLFERCADLNPNYAPAYFWLGFLEIYDGQPGAAIPLIERAFRLSPRDGLAAVWHYALGYSHLLMGDDAAALESANNALGLNPEYPNALWLRAAALGNLDRLDDAKAALLAWKKIVPGMNTIADWRKQRTPAENPRYLALDERTVAGIRKAGLPDSEADRP